MQSRQMDVYTGPIGLYAYLAQRARVAPIMLRRNLSYRREAYEAERRRVNAQHSSAPSGKLESDAHPDDGKERADARAARGGEAAGDMLDASGAKRDAPDDTAHGGADGGGGVGGKRAQDSEQPCSRRSMHAVKKTAVIFRMRYQEGQQESVHRAPELRCPWCEMTCGELESLMWHLQASHDRFSYTLDKSLAMPEIYINVKASSGTEELHRSLAPHTDFCFLSERRKGGSLNASIARLLACEDDANKHDDNDDASKKRKRLHDESVAAVGTNSKGKQAAPLASKTKKGKKGARIAVERKSLAERHLFRSQTCLPIDVNDEMDMDYDSDDDVDDEWQLAQAERLMDEFEDVTSKEKEFMKMWNRFVHRHAILADFQVAVACETFARHFGSELVSKGLRDELLFHMFALWDFNLIGKAQIMAAIALVDKCAADQVADGASSRGGAARRANGDKHQAAADV